MAEITAPSTVSEVIEREQRQIDQANSTGKTPVVFIHGLWLLPSSWDNWVGLFEENGYAGVTPSWPDDPESVEEARANPEVFARKTLKRVADHTAEVIGKLDKKPAVMGHSTGGLLTYMIADRGLSAASVAIDPGPFRGVLPLPLSTLKVTGPVLANPLNRGRAITLTFDQFKYGWANALERRGGAAAIRHVPRPRPRGGPGADGERKCEPLHRGEGRSQKSRPWPAADHRGREGPHRPLGDRPRGVQAPEAQPVRHRDHQDPEPRALAHDRQRLARGGTNGARLREAIRLVALCVDATLTRRREPGFPERRFP
jgi:pimeloyl-ACP methyl ester carboxylesterase